jgi:hypothetical protein
MPLGFAKWLFGGTNTKDPYTIDFLAVGGGGAGGDTQSGNYGGGGGAGAVATSYGNAIDGLSLTPEKTYTITVGAGGPNTGDHMNSTGDGLGYLTGRMGRYSVILGHGIVPVVAQGGGGGGLGYGSFGGGDEGYGNTVSFGAVDTGNKKFTISNVQKTNGTVRVTTSTEHGLSNFGSPAQGGYVNIQDVGGMTQINCFTIYNATGAFPGIGFPYNVIDSTNIDLYTGYTINDIRKIDTSTYGNYTSGGTLSWVYFSQSGSGGGAGAKGPTAGYTGGAAFTADQTYPNGDGYYQSSWTSKVTWTSHAGANSPASPTTLGGGGGGSSAAGSGGTGGAGTSNSITGSAVTYAAGGDSTPGTATTGYGDGGKGENSGNAGVVILRMPTANYSGLTTGSPTVSTDGSDTILTYTSDGTYTA